MEAREKSIRLVQARQWWSELGETRGQRGRRSNPETFREERAPEMGELGFLGEERG